MMNPAPWYRRPWTVWRVINITGAVLFLGSCAKAASSGEYGGVAGMIVAGVLVLTISTIVAAVKASKTTPSNVSAATVGATAGPTRVTSARRPSRPKWPTPASERALLEAAARPAYALHGSDGSPNVETEGEFARIEAITAVLGRRPSIDEEIIAEHLAAALIPEPANPYDHGAIAVVVAGRHVAYLSREDARAYAEPLARVMKAGLAPTTHARIWAVQRLRRDGTKIHANVRVALAQPSALLPANEPPAVPHSMLPWGRAQQVSGEELHLEKLAEYIGEDGRPIIGTLHIDVLRSSERAQPRTVVEVRIDDQSVGHLSTTVSQHFIPVIQHISDYGAVTAAWLRVKGSPVAAQVSVQAMKAHDIPAEWFRELRPVQGLVPASPPGATPHIPTSHSQGE